MKRYQTLIIVIILLLAVTTVVGAATGPGFLRQRFVSFGMQPITKGNMTLRGTFGQPFVETATNGHNELCTGMWCGWPILYEVMLPVVMR